MVCSRGRDQHHLASWLKQQIKIKKNKVDSSKEEEKKPLAFHQEKFLLSEIPYLLKHRGCQSVKSPSVLFIQIISFYQERYLLLNEILDMFTRGPPLPMSPHLNYILWLCWDPAAAVAALLATAPVPSSHSHHPNVKKNKVGFGIFLSTSCLK